MLFFDDIIKLEDFMTFSYKSLIDSKPLQIRFDKIDGIRAYDGIRYLAFFGTKKYGTVYNRIRCFNSLKSNIIYSFSLFCKNPS